MADLTCPACERATNDGLLCGRCAERTKRDLLAIARWWPALTDVLAKLARRGGGGGKRNDPSPLPLDAHAMKVRSYVRNQLSGWCRELDMGDLPRDHGRDMALWLARRIERIRGHAAADEVHDEFAYCRSLVMSAVDAKRDQVYCGPCETCGGDLYVNPGASNVLCRRCERAGIDVEPVEVEKRREKMLDEARRHGESTLLTIGELVEHIDVFHGIRLKQDTIRSWVDRNRLVRRPGRLYVVSEAVALAVELRDKQSRRAERAG